MLPHGGGAASVTLKRLPSHIVSGQGPEPMKRALPTCRDMSELATGYMEGTLPVPMRARARLHLLLCEPCRRYYDQLRRTVALLRGRVVPVDQGIEDRIIAAVERKD